eukprot:8863323-Lingulodinium_polyedra.AAC.1
MKLVSVCSTTPWSSARCILVSLIMSKSSCTRAGDDVFHDHGPWSWRGHLEHDRNKGWDFYK